MILVTGDVVLDHNVYAGQRLTPTSARLPGTRVDKQPGGAALGYRLLGALTPGNVHFGLSNTSAEQLEQWPGAFHAGALWEPSGGVWRLSRSLGYGPPAPDKSYPGVPVPDMGGIKPRVLVIDDGGLGFRHRTPSHCWPPISSDLEWIVLKMSRPLARGDLWRELTTKWNEKLILVVSADNLRAEDARIRKGMSWESTVDDLVDEMQSNPALRGLRSCRHLVIALRDEAALWFDQPSFGDAHCRLIFDRGHNEGETEAARSHGAFGFLSVLTASIAWRQWREPSSPDLTEALRGGLSAIQFLRKQGHGPVQDESPGFPFADAAAQIRDPTGIYAVAEVPCTSGPPWSILGSTFQSEATPGPLFGPARRLALLGPASLENVPYGRFGKLLTMDRSEIEGLHSLRQLMLAYDRAGRQKRPLSFAVFGAPGSGKSFGLKQIAAAVFGSDNPIREFNLSQFKGPEDLIGGFHQIRDCVLAGTTPVAFWDEFDSGNYKWLKYFLAPMQDGTFQEGQHTHAVGKCVFVFAGGTSRDFDHFGPPAPSEEDDRELRQAAITFRMAKGPDFKSRLAGFLDILGPNPRQRYDRELARKGLDPWCDDPTDIDFPVRRAILLRTLLRMVKDAEDAPLDIDRGLLTALLRTGHYKNGARSMEKLIEQIRPGSDGVLRRSHLPPDNLLALYIDDVGKFHELMRQSYRFQAQAERLAPSIHRDYRDGLTAAEKGNAYDVPYEALDQEGKEANIASALRIPEILALAGFSLEEAQATPADEQPVQAFLKKHLEFLAEEEHKGWEEQKRTEGWTYGVPRDNKNRKHHLLVPYAKLPNDQKDKDRRTIMNYPKYAGEAGFKIAQLGS